jgi:hypothetical protein
VIANHLIDNQQAGALKLAQRFNAGRGVVFIFSSPEEGRQKSPWFQTLSTPAMALLSCLEATCRFSLINPAFKRWAITGVLKALGVTRRLLKYRPSAGLLQN